MALPGACPEFLYQTLELALYDGSVSGLNAAGQATIDAEVAVDTAIKY